ncbi:hypothetical protein [Gilliamella sp. N-G2]|uniref:hypothetical protein n=1 Tax=Gilliamella sp. N-G2 TaxID=1970471 RepID=UPI000A35AEE5|nr:hypothetical protein [Gilliamella sp. N-G2]OTQ71864.1 hypothetical protein B6C99_11690 [Gilliamella sp. N-G2]
MKFELITLLSKQFDKTTASRRVCFIRSLIAKLNLNGYTVEKEARHPHLASAKINFKVTKHGQTCWIELDNKSPRIRSLESIQSINEHGGNGFILLRNSFLSQHKKLGIDIISARS